MTKTKKRIFVSALASLLLVLTVFLGFGTLTASAATTTTATYTTYGTYTYDGSTYSGYPSSYFKIMMHGSSTSGTGTIYNDRLTDWSYYYIKVDAIDVREHISFKLYRNGSLYSSKSLSGESDLTLYSGSLPDGEYEIQYIVNIGSWISNKDYTYRYRFEVDKTAPSYTLKAGGSTISSGSYTNKQIVYTASDTNFNYIRYYNPSAGSYYSYYSTSYTVAATTANNGWWYFYAVDDNGTSNSTVSVYLDTVIPTGKVTNASGTTIANNGYANSAIKYTASDTGSGISYLQYKQPGSSSWATYTSGTAVTGTGWHTWRAVDRAGNTSSEYTVYYDAGAPTGTLYGGTSTKSSGSYTNASYVKYVASDSYSGIANCYVRMPGSSYYTAYASGTQLATQGTYYFYSVDKSGNSSSTVSITLDTTKPTGTLYAGSSVVSSGTVTSASYIKYVPSDNIALGTSYVMKPGTSSYVTYTSGTQFTAEGLYRFYTYDAASNISATYEITINRDVPSAQLFVDGDEIGNGGYTNGAHIKFESDAAKCFVKLPDSDTFVEYMSGAEFYKEGKYTFYGLSESSVSTGYYTVVIDRTIKTVDISNLTDGNTDGDVVITWTNGDAELYAPIKRVTVNGKSYTKGETIYTIDTGVYEVVVIDHAGNIWTTEFTSTKKNVLTDTLQKEYYEAFDVNGDFFAFSTYENALAFATAREKSLVTTGTWNSNSWDAGIAMDAIDAANAVNGQYFIYKKSGNPDELVAYFTEERLNAVIAEYAKIDIKDFFYWEKEPATAGEGENLYSYSDSKNILASSVTFGDNIAVLINGEEFIGNLYEVEGKALLTVCDEWGNTCDYNLTVIRKAPEILYAVGEGSINPVVYDRTYYLKEKVTVSISDGFDEMAMFSVYDESNKLIGNFSIGETYAFTASGRYTVVAVNHYGESETFTLVISLDAPKVSVTENAEEKKLDIVITKSVDDESHIQTIIILKSTDGGNTWVEVDKDDYDTVVSTKTLAYSFRTSAIYKVSVTDEFRTGIDTVTAQLDYVQRNPEGTLIGVDNNGHTNGTVKFEWTDEAIVVLTKDGDTVDYKSGDELTEDGVYTLTFENFDGYKATFTFTIDTAAPVITTEGADHRESVNQDVKVFYTEENLTAELFKDGKSLGEYTSGNPISADGQYRVRVADQAGNEVSVEFTIDKTVSYSINVFDGGLSNSVVATANEQVTVSLTKNGKAIDYALGSAITEPADYVLVLTDAVNNRAEIAFKVIEPVVKSFSHNLDKIEGLGGVTVNGNEHRLNYGTLELKDDGVYEVGVIVGGETYTFKVTVDTLASYTANVHNGGFANSVTIKADENVTVSVTKNGEAFTYELGKEITEPAKYTVKVTDAIGNTSEFSFTIVEAKVGKFDQELDNVAGFEKVLVNGTEATLDRGSLILTESGTYEVAVVANGVSRTFTVTVDATAPSISLNGVENGGKTKDAVTIGNPSEDATVKVTKDGEEIAYKLGDEITEPGEYKVTVTDEIGNASEYSFTIKAGLNGGIIALIVIVSILAVGGVVVFILKKKEII